MEHPYVSSTFSGSNYQGIQIGFSSGTIHNTINYNQSHVDSRSRPSSLVPIARSPEFTQDEQDCLKSLHFEDMNDRANDIANPANETCQWLLKHEDYLKWLNQHCGLLWIKGNPGAGKSTLIRHTLKVAKEQSACSNVIIASFFFHGRGDEIQKNSLGLFRSLLHQILQLVPDLRSSFTTVFKRRCETEGSYGEKWKWHKKELQDFFEERIMLTAVVRPIYIYIDALDEGGEEVAINLIAFFQSLISKHSSLQPRFKVCFSCRHYPLIVPKNIPQICVDHENDQDIRTYVQAELERNVTDVELVHVLQDQIVRKSSRIFLWVTLVVPKVVGLLRKGKPQELIQKIIELMPKELDELYQDLLKGLDPEEQAQSLQLMQWICFAFTPLSLKELRIAIAVNINKSCTSLRQCQNTVDYAKTDEEMEKRVKDLSRGLAEVMNHDGKHIVQFIHQSVSDFCIQNGLGLLGSNASNVVADAHFQLSRTCIRYLSMEEVSDALPEIYRSTLKTYGFGMGKNELESFYPLLRYAALHWAPHAEAVEKEQIDQDDLLQFFPHPSSNALQNWIQAYQIIDGYSHMCPCNNTTILHVVSRYGIVSSLNTILESDNIDVDLTAEDGRTSLHWAAYSGYNMIVRLLIGKKANVNAQGGFWGNALQAASFKGHEKTVKLLISEGAYVSIQGGRDGNALQAASSEGHKKIVELLISEGADVNVQGGRYGNALQAASFKGHEKTVELLINEGADVNAQGGRYGNALQAASSEGHERIFELLISKGADINAQGGFYANALQAVSIRGEEQTVELLISEGADINAQGGRYGTALQAASIRGKAKTVELLICKGANVNAQGGDYGNALYAASSGGHEKIVEILISKGADVNAQGGEYGTALHAASEGGHDRVVELLIDRGATV